MQNLSLLQLLKLLSAAAPVPTEDSRERTNGTFEPPTPENKPENEPAPPPAEKSDCTAEKPTSDAAARAYEIFSARHEQAVRHARADKSGHTK